jgi:hypothetical protein
MTIETFAPFNQIPDDAESCTAWSPCRQAREKGVEFCQAIAAACRALQPTGGLDGGRLNRLAIQAITGLSPEQQPRLG